MALAHVHLIFLVSVKRHKVDQTIPVRSIMELGEQNWFGDVNPREIALVVDEFYTGEKASNLKEQLNNLLSNDSKTVNFDLAKLFYNVIFENTSYAAIDLRGTSSALKLDLNNQLDITEQFDLVTNLGTAEHVFNQYHFFKNMHDLTKPGGLMLHTLPNQGGYDHGFYNYHPKFCFDLCEANNYSPLSVVFTEGSGKTGKITNIDRASYAKLVAENQLGRFSSLLVLLQKNSIESEFIIPT